LKLYRCPGLALMKGDMILKGFLVQPAVLEKRSPRCSLSDGKMAWYQIVPKSSGEWSILKIQHHSSLPIIENVLKNCISVAYLHCRLVLSVLHLLTLLTPLCSIFLVFLKHRQTDVNNLTAFIRRHLPQHTPKIYIRRNFHITSAFVQFFLRDL